MFAAAEAMDDAERDHEDRHQDDVDRLQRAPEAFNFAVQVLADILQLAAGLRLLLAELVELGLLFLRKNHPLVALLLLLQGREALLRLAELRLQPLRLGLPLAEGFRLEGVDLHEGTVEASARTHTDQL